MGISKVGVDTESDLSLSELLELVGDPKKAKKALAEMAEATRQSEAAAKAAEAAQDGVRRERKALEDEDRALDAKRDAIAKREARIEGIDADATEREARLQQGLKDLRAGQAALVSARETFDKGIGAAEKKAERDLADARELRDQALLVARDAEDRMEAMRKVLD